MVIGPFVPADLAYAQGGARHLMPRSLPRNLKKKNPWVGANPYRRRTPAGGELYIGVLELETSRGLSDPLKHRKKAEGEHQNHGPSKTVKKKREGGGTINKSSAINLYWVNWRKPFTKEK